MSCSLKQSCCRRHFGDMKTIEVITCHVVVTKMASLRVVLGCGEIGRRRLSEDKPCQELFSACLSLGCNEIDTAFMYTGGKSEEIIGRLPEKSKFEIATKANPWSDAGLKYDRVLEQMRISLERLQLPSVDVFYLHAPDHNTPIEITLSAVQKLYEEGKFKEFGVCNYASWEVAEIYYLCKANGWILPTIYQGMYNPITRMVEGELFPCLRRLGIRFYAFNPLACGVLTGKFKYTDLEDKDNKEDGRFFVENEWTEVYRKRYWRKIIFDGVSKVRQSLDEVYGVDKVSLTSATFRWMNHHSAMKPNDGIVLGGSSLNHFSENIKSCREGPLDKRIVDAFDEVWQSWKGENVNYYR